jgi:hypothetical protein
MGQLNAVAIEEAAEQIERAEQFLVVAVQAMGAI